VGEEELCPRRQPSEITRAIYIYMYIRLLVLQQNGILIFLLLLGWSILLAAGYKTGKHVGHPTHVKTNSDGREGREPGVVD
jgi:hypothetical protein